MDPVATNAAPHAGPAAAAGLALHEGAFGLGGAAWFLDELAAAKGAGADQTVFAVLAVQTPGLQTDEADTARLPGRLAAVTAARLDVVCGTHGDDDVAAAELLQLADEAGLGEPLTGWLLRQTCLQQAAWRRQGWGGLRLAVPLGRGLLQPGTLAGIGRTCAFEAREGEPLTLCVRPTGSAPALEALR